MNRIFHIIAITIALIVHQYLSCSALSRNSDVKHERNKRFAFLKTSGVGYIVALAVPTSSVNRQRVYMAFNFEAHYTLADNETLLSKFRMPFPGDDINQVKRDVHGTPARNRIKHFTGNRNIYTRKNLYRILEQQIESYGFVSFCCSQTYGYNGTACLLRVICETSETPFHEYNGVFGNIFHILFTPSSSKPEKIRSIFIEAEYDGRMQECHRYFNDCNISFLDLISNMISIESRKFIK